MILRHAHTLRIVDDEFPRIFSEFDVRRFVGSLSLCELADSCLCEFSFNRSRSFVMIRAASTTYSASSRFICGLSIVPVGCVVEKCSRKSAITSVHCSSFARLLPVIVNSISSSSVGRGGAVLKKK